MRGKATPLQRGEGGRRITPAYAGKSDVEFNPKGFVEDHPRLCGEKRTTNHGEKLETGSPPPMRGKGSDLSQTPESVRITPAYAGKRSYHKKRSQKI